MRRREEMDGGRRGREEDEEEQTQEERSDQKAELILKIAKESEIGIYIIEKSRANTIGTRLQIRRKRGRSRARARRRREGRTVHCSSLRSQDASGC